MIKMNLRTHTRKTINYEFLDVFLLYVCLAASAIILQPDRKEEGSITIATHLKILLVNVPTFFCLRTGSFIVS